MPSKIHESASVVVREAGSDVKVLFEMVSQGTYVNAVGIDEDERLTQELADVMGHFLVTMSERGIEPHA